MTNVGIKLKTAARVLVRQGPIAFLKAFKRYAQVRFGPYRPDEAKIVFEVLNADTVGGLMIDVGAHHGSALSPFASSGWKVFAFEPDSKNRKTLVERFGNFKNVVIDSRAISDHQQEKAVLYRSEISTGISGLSSFHSSHQPEDEVEVTTLENFFDKRGITDGVTFLKIDTEGFDLNVLRGFPWNRAKPRMILCEFEDSKTLPLGYTVHDLTNFLVGHGYKVVISEWYPIKRYGGLHDWRRFAAHPFQLQDPKAWGNIFATNDNELYKKLLQACNLDS